jgi:hypothetical protein
MSPVRFNPVVPLYSQITGWPAASSRPRRCNSSLADRCERLSRSVAPCLVPRQMHQRSATLSVPMMACRIFSVSATLRKRSDTHSQSSDPGGSCDASTDCQALLIALMKAFSPRHSRARNTCVPTLAPGVMRRPRELPLPGPRGSNQGSPSPGTPTGADPAASWVNAPGIGAVRLAQVLARGNAQFAEDVAQVPFNGARTDEHLGCYLRIC